MAVENYWEFWGHWLLGISDFTENQKKKERDIAEVFVQAMLAPGQRN